MLVLVRLAIGRLVEPPVVNVVGLILKLVLVTGFSVVSGAVMVLTGVVTVVVEPFVLKLPTLGFATVVVPLKLPPVTGVVPAVDPPKVD